MRNTKAFSIFGSYHRVKILACLAKGDLDVTQTIKQCGLSQSAVSQHLKKMRDAKLVKVRQDGRRRIYSLADKQVGRAAGELLRIFTK
jgi:ArsR family transcriptional regulator